MTSKAVRDDLVKLSSEWTDVVEKNRFLPLQPDEITAQMLSKEIRQKVDYCTRLLFDMYKNKQATRRWILWPDGIRRLAYRKIKRKIK